MRDAAADGMYLSLENEQVELLRDVLQHALRELRVEEWHTDTRAFRQMLHQREDVVEAVLAKLTDTGKRTL